MTYARIAPLPEGFADAEANSVQSLRDAWVEQRSGLAEGGVLSTFNERLARRWAIETGIIERLYTLDRGTTAMLVEHGLNAALIEHGASDTPPAQLVEMLSDHREAVAYVMDHVSRQQPLTNHFIRSLHGLLTRHQDHVEAEDQFGNLVRTSLLRGAWKTIPNNPRRPDGVIHLYCPPALVEEEMTGLLESYAALEKSQTPTVTKAAWLHHRFTQIHPFQDGNGRVARAITAFVFVQAGCFPIIVDRDMRSPYIEALEQADDGDLRPLVRLFARLEKKEIEEALSLSETALSETARTAGASLRPRLFAALRERAREKREAITQSRGRVMEKGDRVFSATIKPAVEKLADELQQILGSELPGSSTRVEWSDDQTRHYFKAQIVDIANREGYYCDLETFHRWVRLRLKRPGEAEDNVSEIVISMHSLGPRFTGVLAVGAHYATRFKDEEHRSVTLPPHPLSERSLTFSYLEDQDNISARVEEWVANALDLGIAELLNRL